MILFLSISSVLAGNTEPQTNEPILAKIYLKHQTDIGQLAAVGFDLVEVKPDFIKALVSSEQITWLRNRGFTTELLSLSELADWSVTKKAAAGLYHTYNETTTELRQIEASHENIAKVIVLGKSIQGRDILAIKISDNPSLEEEAEPNVLFMGCHHAREWISVEMPLYLANYLVSNYESNPEVKKLVDERETWIVPIVNPDGLEYSQTIYTLWRKNMRDNNGNSFFERSYDGVDLNRNYGYKWGYDDIGSSPYPEDETFRGKNAFSEPETQAIGKLAVAHNFIFAISFHSYGQVMVYPWGYANLDTVDDRLFTDVASKMAFFNGYAYGNAKDGVMYNTNGDVTDWLYAQSGTLGYTIELATAFIPPENQIEQIWLKNKNATLYLLLTADNPRQIYPNIGVFTDKASYSNGDMMKVGIELKHSENAIVVGIGVWVDLPNGDKYWVVHEPYVTVPKGFNYNNLEWKSFVLPTLQPGNYSWHAVVVDAYTMYRMSESKYSWVFNAS